MMGGSLKEYHQGIYTLGLPKYLFVKFPKPLRGLWAKRLVNFNFEGHLGIFLPRPRSSARGHCKSIWSKMASFEAFGTR